MQKATGNDVQAEATLTQAVWTAEIARRDDIVARAGIALAGYGVYASPPRVTEARIWHGLAVAAAKRTGSEHEYEAGSKLVEAVLDVYEGNVKAGVVAGEASFAASTQEYGANSGIVYSHEILFAGTLARALQYAKAAPHYEHAIAVRSQFVGDNYPDVALAWSNLAVCYHFMGELDRARATFGKALALREKLFGAASPVLVPTLDNYGVFLTQTDDPTKARAMLERALVLAEGIPGKDTPDYDVVATDRADAVVAQGKLAEAHALFDALLESETTRKSSTLPATQTSRALLALAEKDVVAAERYARLAIAGFEAVGGKDNPELWKPAAALGRALAAQALSMPGSAAPLTGSNGAVGTSARGLKTEEARMALHRAIDIGTSLQLAPALLQPARDALGTL
ncbi:MAG: tetratricopeptide repeat protein [Kofleriaceae bacterium]